MSVVFSTPQTLYTYDFVAAVLTPVATSPREFYRISGGAGKLILTHSCIDPETLKTHADFRGSPLGILSISSGDSSMRTEPCLLQPHQIECHQGVVLCANAGRNCLTVVDQQWRCRNVFPSTARWDIGPGERKANHFNSVHVEGTHVYLLAHNYDRYSAVWVFEWPDLALVDVIPTRAEWAHNVWTTGGDLIVCNSKAGTLYCVTAREDVWAHDGRGYITRGLAANATCVVVGLSALASRGDRKDSDSGFCIVDRKTMRTLDTYIFPGVGAVHEIRLLDEPDLCHSQDVLHVPDRFDHRQSLARGAANAGH